MTKNPFLNALAAVGYIVLIALLFFTLSQLMVGDPHPVIAATGFLSLFVFSAALMGYFIILTPLRLFLEGEKQAGIALFVQTILSLAAIAAIVCIAGVFLIPAPPELPL